ncbi:helix-turn-helix domain-containing protein [Pengzhenrongella phosphoraccumulans]|uniref:helix-turn-helix domain-containing protein n=1 Tax=Pengzhenrongella phosphoraccumulans TaxID=3114394 RepID=UPI003890ED86
MIAGRSSKGGSEELAAVLRERREATGMSRRDLAEASGLSYPYISQLETAYRLPSPRAMKSLANALEVPVTDLFDALPQEPEPRGEMLMVAALPPDASWSDSGAAGEQWIVNPSHVRRSAPPSRVGRREAARSAIASLVELDPEQRLAALSEVQAAVVASVVRDQVRTFE